MEKIVICGGGFGGITAAKDLADLKKYEIHLISKVDKFTFIPSIHEIVSGKVEEDDISFPLSKFCEENNIHFHKEAITHIDTKKQVVHAETDHSYDVLLTALGSVTHYYGVPQTDQTFELKTMKDALKMKQKIRDLIREDEKAQIHIVGGGVTGVELAAEIADTIKDTPIDLIILEGQNQLLPGYSQKVSKFCTNFLKKKGIIITTGVRVESIDDKGIHMDTGNIPTDMVIWTAGITSHPIVPKMGLPTNKRGSLIVDSYLQSPKDAHVFGVGDSIYYKDPVTERIAWPTAKKAIEAGAMAAKNIDNYLSGKKLIPWRLKANPFLISLGKNMAIGSMDEWKETYFSGYFPSLAKHQVQKNFMREYK